MCAFRIASLFSRNVAAKDPEPTAKTSICNKNPVEEKRTIASAHINSQLDSEATQNIKSQPKKRPLPNNLDTESAKLNTGYQVNPNDSKSLQSEDLISGTNTTPAKLEDTIDSRSLPHKYREFLNMLPAAGRQLGETCKLNECEMAAIRCYTGDDYFVINSTLRSLNGTDVDFYKADSLKSFGVDDHFAEIISDLANGMRKLPPTRTDSKSSFGLGRDVTLKGDALNRMKEGEIISDLMFTSTTTRLEQVADGAWWYEDQVLIIHQRVDGNGRDIAAFSGHNESEILFLPGTRFLITYRKDDAIVGRGGNWGPIYEQLNKAFFDAFTKEYVDQLGHDRVLVNDALGQSYPLNFEAAADLMDTLFPEKFFIKKIFDEKDKIPGKKTSKNEKGGDAEKITIDLEKLHSLSRKLHTEEYGGAIKPDTEMNKTVITMEEISPDDELRINSEKSQATAKNEMISRIPSDTSQTSESERRIPVRGQNNAPEKTEGKMPLKRPNTKSAETERKIPVRDQSKSQPQPNTAAKPSSKNKEGSKANFRNDDYSISDAANYGEYFPGFSE